MPAAQNAEQTVVTIESSNISDLLSNVCNICCCLGGANYIHKHSARRAEVGECVNARTFSCTVIHRRQIIQPKDEFMLPSGGVEITPFVIERVQGVEKSNHQSRIEYVPASSGHTQHRRQ